LTAVRITNAEIYPFTKMSDVVHGIEEQALALLAALGFSPDDHVVSLKLSVSGKDFVTVEVEKYVTPIQHMKLVTVVERYKLVPKDPA
jgi:hypothetical protein